MKNKIINELKLFLLIFLMTSGIYFNLTFIWVLVGLPKTWWALCLIGVVAGLLEILYINWITVKTED